MKICRICKSKKELYQFYKDIKSKDKLRSLCKICDNKRKKEWKIKNPLQAQLTGRKNRNEWRRKHRAKNRDHQLYTKYGINSEIYNNMVKKQDNKCAICKKEEWVMDSRFNKIRSLSIDHCHETKKVRGLLCTNCNHGLGSFKDNINSLLNAIDYLNQSKRIPGC